MEGFDPHLTPNTGKRLRNRDLTSNNREKTQKDLERLTFGGIWTVWRVFGLVGGLGGLGGDNRNQIDGFNRNWNWRG